jgi:GH3 auxin-responsive promoter
MIASLLFALSYRRFLAACRDPFGAQVHVLRRILRQAAHTGIGEASEFLRIARLRDDGQVIRTFQATVPIRPHAAMRDDLEAVYAGDWRRLCPSRPLFFAMTAGSTGRYKYIPFTREFRRELGAGSRIFYGALEAGAPGLRGRKAQFLVGSAEGGMTPDGIPQGFASGFNYRNLPRLVRDRFILPYWIFTLEDVEDRCYAAGRLLAGNRDLGALCAISPVNLINVRQALERNAERLFSDLEAGTLTLRGEAAARGEFHGRPDPRLAAALREAWVRDGTLPNRLLFPSLELLVCWQGGNMSYYLDELDRHFGLSRHFEFPISASEGIFAIPHRRDRAGGILAVTSHFLEFLPEDAAIDSAEPLTADRLRPGAEYRLVVTNSGGLYRYDMEDIVRVTSQYRRTPVIEFVSKKDRQVSVSNERITELDVTLAMQTACREAGCWFPEFLFVPCTDRRYRVVIDGAVVGTEDAPFGGAVDDFAAELERQLRRAARGYDFERADGLLEPLELIVTAPGELRAWLERRQGGPRLANAQIKPLHLTNQFDAHTSFHAVAAHAA